MFIRHLHDQTHELFPFHNQVGSLSLPILFSFQLVKVHVLCVSRTVSRSHCSVISPYCTLWFPIITAPLSLGRTPRVDRGCVSLLRGGRWGGVMSVDQQREGWYDYEHRTRMYYWWVTAAAISKKLTLSLALHLYKCSLQFIFIYNQ